MPAKVSSDHLQPILKRAFDHLVQSGDYPKTPDWRPVDPDRYGLPIAGGAQPGDRKR